MFFSPFRSNFACHFPKISPPPFPPSLIMKAIQVSRIGGPEVLEWKTDVEKPQPAKGIHIFFGLVQEIGGIMAISDEGR